jgi:hypothetical protein
MCRRGINIKHNFRRISVLGGTYRGAKTMGRGKGIKLIITGKMGSSY